MDLLSYITSEKDGIKTTTTVFNPTGVHIWEIPTKNVNPPGVPENYQSHGILIGRDPITGEMTSRVETNNGKKVDGWLKPGVQHTPILASGGEEKAWVWANPDSDHLLRAKVDEFYRSPQKGPPRGEVKPASPAEPAPQA